MNCAIYIRKSREETGKESHRLNVQRQQLPAHAQANGWTPIIYDDGHASAAMGKAENLEQRTRLEQDIRAGKIDIILTIELSRLSRDESGRDFLNWVQMCADHNVKLATLSQILDPSEISHNILLRMTDVMSASEMLWLKKRMREGRIEAQKAGKFLSGNPPTPYIHDKTNGGLIIDQKQLAETMLILTMAETSSAKQIAEQFGKAEITIRRMISDPRLLMYQGKRINPETGETIDGQWQAIINADQAARIKAGRRTRKSSGKAKEHAGLLSNLDKLLLCGYCGRTAKTWRNSRARKDGGRNNYYGCTASCAKRRLVQQQIIDEKVVINLLNTITSAEDLKSFWLENVTNNDTARQQLEEIAKEETDLKTKKQRLVQAISEGIIDFGDAKDTRQKIESALAALQIRRQQITSDQRTQPDFDTLAVNAKDWGVFTTTEHRKIIKICIESVKLFNTYALIEYKFPRTIDGTTTARIHLPERYNTPTRSRTATKRKQPE